MRGAVTATSWQLPDGMSEEEWGAAGAVLGQVERSATWWIGDWWAYGKPWDRARTELVKSENWDGPDYGTCRNAATVAAAFELSRRRDSLSFKHHTEVAGLSATDADRLLDVAEAQEWSTRQLRAEVSKLRSRVGAVPSDETCTTQDIHTLLDAGKRFGCIYADPPWLYDNQGTRSASGKNYEGLTVAELCDLPIRQLASDAAHLHLWTTNAFIFEAPKIFAAWGFEFRSSFVWVKSKIGIGNYWRNAHEFLLTAVRGDAKHFNDHSLISWIEVDRGRHSGKPEQVRSMLEKASPGPYLELFGRLPANGWTVWGNEIERNLFQEASA